MNGRWSWALRSNVLIVFNQGMYGQWTGMIVSPQKQSLRETLRDFLEEIVTVIHIKVSLEDSLDNSFIELSSASVIATGQGGRPITDIKHIEWFIDWLGGPRCSRKALDHSPPPFLPLNQAKEISSRELRVLQVNFPYNFLLKTIRKSPPGSSGSSRSMFLKVPYSKQ